ncbi:histidine kinase [Chitinophaga lutea]
MPGIAYILIIAALAGLLAYTWRRMAQYRAQYEAAATLNYFTTSLFGKNTTEDILWDVAKNCISRLHLEDCVIYLVDEARQVLVQKAAYGPKNPIRFEIHAPIEIPVGRGIVGSVAATGRAEIVHDTSLDERYIVDDERRLSEITVPIIYNGKVIGVIDSEHSRKYFYTGRHLFLLEKIAEICASKISRSLMEEQAYRQEQEVQLLHKQLAEFRLVTLKSQMNPHFLFNCLNGIYHCILAGHSDKAAEYVSNFARLLRMVLMHSEKNFITLREETDLLRHYLKIESLRSDKPFAFDIEVEDNIDPDDYFVPGMLIQPFLENAIWHGLMHKDGERQLVVRWRRQTDTSLSCEIVDNGIGRAESARRRIGGHVSRGMELCMERVELYKVLFNTTFNIRIADLYNDDGAAAGTRVDIAFEAARDAGVAHVG